MIYCRMCGKLTDARGWRWFVCENCESFQQAVQQVAEEYHEDIPEAAIKALEASLNLYDTKTGQSTANRKAQPVRESITLTRKHGFYGAFKRPSQVHSAIAGAATSILATVLKSGILPSDLTAEIQGFLDEMETKAEQLTRVLTYQRFDQQWCAFLSDQMDEEAIGKTEEEALENIYLVHPELRLVS